MALGSCHPFERWITMTTYNYQVSTGTWDAITQEVTRLTPMIQNNEDLTPDDVKEVKRLVKEVETASKEYNKALTASYKQYKAMLSAKLEEIGYTVIDNYIVKRRKEQQDAISTRLTSKVNHFTDLVRGEIEKTTNLKHAKFIAPIPSQMMALFPNVNSGAVTKEISDWSPIELMVHELITYADEKVNNLITELPATSVVANTFGQFFTTGDRSLLENLHNVLRNDSEWLMNRHIALQLKSEDDLLTMISDIANEKSVESVNQIKRLLNIWDTKHIYLG